MYEHLVSQILGDTIDDIIQTYHSLLQENLTESEIEEKIRAGSFRNYKNTPRSFDKIMYDIDGIVSGNIETLLRQYRGGFKLHILNLLQSFQSSPYSAKEYKKGYLGYKDDT